MERFGVEQNAASGSADGEQTTTEHFFNRDISIPF